MSEFLAPSHEHEAETPATPEPAVKEAVVEKKRASAHRETLRFHLFLNLALAIAATWVLKLDGPYYADGIAAGIFVVGFLIAIWSFRTIRKTEAVAGWSGVSTAPVFGALAIFFIAAAAAVIWFTYISPPDAVYSDESSTAMWLTLRRQFA